MRDDGVRSSEPARDAALRFAELMENQGIAVDTDDPADALDAQQFLISLALRTTAQTWPELRDASRQRHRESIAAFAEFYASLMEAYGLRMKAPLTVADFTEAMAAMGEGFAVRAMEGLEHPVYHAAEDDDVPTGEWTLFALGVRALVNEFMTPIDATARMPFADAPVTPETPIAPAP